MIHPQSSDFQGRFFFWKKRWYEIHERLQWGSNQGREGPSREGSNSQSKSRSPRLVQSGNHSVSFINKTAPSSENQPSLHLGRSLLNDRDALGMSTTSWRKKSACLLHSINERRSIKLINSTIFFCSTLRTVWIVSWNMNHYKNIGVIV